jgi:hypothetical protein
MGLQARAAWLEEVGSPRLARSPCQEPPDGVINASGEPAPASDRHAVAPVARLVHGWSELAPAAIASSSPHLTSPQL